MHTRKERVWGVSLNEECSEEVVKSFIQVSSSRSLFQFSSVQSLSRVQLFATPSIAARQASLSITNSWSLLKLMPIKSVMLCSHLILCRPLLLLPLIPPSIRVFSNKSTLRMRWPKYWSFSFSISPSNEHPRTYLLQDLLAVQGTLKSLLQSSPKTVFTCLCLPLANYLVSFSTYDLPQDPPHYECTGFFQDRFQSRNLWDHILASHTMEWRPTPRLLLTPKESFCTCEMSPLPQEWEVCDYLLQSFNRVQSNSWRRQWHPTPVLLPGKPHGGRSLLGCSPQGH